MKYKKFTFKTNKASGIYGGFSKPSITIKVDGKYVGDITTVGRINFKYQVGLMVIKDDINEDRNPNCTWMWVRLNKFETIQKAKDWIRENNDLLQQQFHIYKGQ